MRYIFEALEIFKEFKGSVEIQLGRPIKVLKLVKVVNTSSMVFVRIMV